MRKIIEVEDLVKCYKTKGGTKRALDRISFTVHEGEVFGLLGPNGAGKTTAIKILTTLLIHDEGTAKVLGHDVKNESAKIRDKINFVYGGERGVYGRLTAREYLFYFCTLYRIPLRKQGEMAAGLLEKVGLKEAANEKIHTFSKGMTQRLHIARCMINSPKVLFLDEPTIGLDPLGAKMLRQLVKDLASEGITIILTTHYMQEADELCDRIAFIKNGTISMTGRPEEIKSSCNHLQMYEAVMSLGNPENIKKDPALLQCSLEEIKAPFYTVRFEIREDRILQDSLTGYLSGYGDVLKVQRRSISLEDAYIFLMKDAV